MTPNSLTGGAAVVTSTGAVGSGLDISGVTGPATLCLEVISMTAGKTARVQIEDSVNAFTAVIPLHVFHVEGQMGDGAASWAAGQYNPATEKQSVQKYQLRNNRFGVSSAVIRPNVTAIDGSSELVINVWLED